MSHAPLRAPSLRRRLACIVYELLILAALVFVATMPFVAVFGDATQGWTRHALQGWIVAVCGVYYVTFWTRGGQTLPMKTWRMRVVRPDGSAIDTRQAVQRYGFAVLGLAAFGLGFLWALVDRDRQFLHDRLAGTIVADTRDETSREDQRLSAR
ncbi:MAG TPA: RDD family protein [Usitatibacter sp.]|nr:RDD family protein [Usitatibacter sp.]